MSDGRSDGGRVLSVTVSPEDGGTARHHFNADNISFVSRVEQTPTTAGWALAIFTTIFGGWLLLEILGNTLVAIFGSLASGFVVVGVLTHGRDEIGTIADTYDIADSEQASESGIESQLLQLETELITIEDVERHFLYTVKYRHHFVPKNIVSIRETSDAPLIAVLLLVVFPIELIYGAMEFGLPIYLGVTLPSRPLPGLEQFLLTAAYIAVVVAPTIYALYRIGEFRQLEINTPANADHTFEVSQSDANRVLRGLQTRDTEQVTAESRRT